jgi:hypothetical protein
MTGQMVGVDLRQGEYIVSTYSKTPNGVWVLDGTPARLPQDSAAGQLGAVIREALAQSRAGVDELTRDSQPSRPLLDLLQVPDFATYAKGTRSIEVYSEPSDDGETIELTPMRNEGSRRGFTPIDEDAQTFVYASPEQLGIAVVSAFSKAV